MQTATFGVSGETSLWLAVLEEAVRSDPAAKVREWLCSQDGRLVAWLAGVDPEWVSDRIVPAVHGNDSARRYHRRNNRGRPAQQPPVLARINAARKARLADTA